MVIASALLATNGTTMLPMTCRAASRWGAWVVLIVRVVGLRFGDVTPEEVPAMYEHHKEPLLPRRQFLRRVIRHGG